MQNEIAKNLALLCNETGIDHLDFDGHEGGQASGQGDYGIEAFSKTFYDHADHFVVNGTSNSKHFYWHMNTYCNWGEPWYGGFRESMQEYRIANQALFERNYMPNMMGWYLMTGHHIPFRDGVDACQGGRLQRRLRHGAACTRCTKESRS